ncbi:MAG: glycosyltransferase family 4 protein [Novosphingobium sp.]
MHIALYSPNWPPAGAANGIVSYVSTIREHLVGEGHKVSVVSNARLYPSDGPDVPLLPPIEEASGLDLIKRRALRRLDQWHGGRPGWGHLLAGQVRTAHRIAPIDILEMEESYGWSHTVARLSGVPVVTRLHGPCFLKPDQPRTAREKLIDQQRCRTEGAAVRSSSTLTAPTRAIMNVTCENYHRTPGAHDAVIPNPIRLTPESRRWRLEGCDRNRILMVGRFDYAKGADTMLLAFDRLLQTHPDARLTLVGPEVGLEVTPGQLASFEDYARARLSPEAASRVELTGTLTPEQIAPLRQQAFVTVIASRAENFPYALAEGLAAGSPMISTAWSASGEIISDGKTGFLTPIGDPIALAQRLAWMMDHPDFTATVGANGRRHCGATFSIETVGNRLLDCLEATIRSAAA